MRAMIVLAALAVLALPAEAQTRLPRTSPAERQVNEINRSVMQEQRQLQIQQQNQIDNNQLRQSQDQQRLFTNPSPMPSRIGTCPPTAIGC